jgi:hypothetical protein
MIRSVLVLLALAMACSKSSEPKPAPAAGSAAAGSATAGSAVATTDAELVNFCVRSYGQMMECFKDDEFWQVFSTMYFANINLTSDETERQHWIGIMKEDLLKLYNEHGFEENCKASVANTKWPTAKSMQNVGDAAQKSCSAFGGAFGYMVFNEGAFHNPK